MSSLIPEQKVDGPSLQSILLMRQGKPFSVTEGLIYLKAIAPALESANMMGMVHGNIQPGTIKVDRGGNIFLTGFGSAWSPGNAAVPAERLVYLSPEQIRGEPISSETDVYTLGALLFQMLTGKQPFDIGQSTPADADRVRFEILRKLPPNPNEQNPGIQDALARVVLRALEKEPKDRYTSAQAMLEAACDAAGTTPGAVPTRTAPPEIGKDYVMPVAAAAGATMVMRQEPVAATAALEQDRVQPTVHVEPDSTYPSGYPEPEGGYQGETLEQEHKPPYILYGVIGVLLLGLLICGGIALAAGLPAIGKMLASPTPTATATATATFTPLPTATMFPTEAPPAIPTPEEPSPVPAPTQAPELPAPTNEPPPTEAPVASCPQGGCVIYLWNYCSFPAIVMMGTEVKSNPQYPIMPGSNFHVHVPPGTYYFTLCEVLNMSSCTDTKPATAESEDVNVYFCR